MKSKEALSLLNISHPLLCRYVRKGRIRITHGTRLHYEYCEEDVRRLAGQLDEIRERRRTKTGYTSEEIAQAIELDLDLLRSQKKDRLLADQRRVMAVVLNHLGWTREEIGTILNRAHSSITIMLQTSYLVEKEAAAAIKHLNELGYGKER